MIGEQHLQLKSWVEVDAQSDFPIQNLPFGIFKTDQVRAGIAIGNFVLDLAYLHNQGFFDALKLPDGIFRDQYLNRFFALGRVKVGEVRKRVAELLNVENSALQHQAEMVKAALIHQREVEMLMPVKVNNYTDFYSSIEHATNVGTMFRDPANALLPNWKHLPVGYHGRASSIVVSGTDLHRPKGQIKLPDIEHPVMGPSRKLDFELEVAFITSSDTVLGQSITTVEAEDHIIGLVLFNDWSARDIQQWEYVPLGPFLGKSFGSTISPWIVLLDALEPFRCDGPKQEPVVLPYLRYTGSKNLDIHLEVGIQPEGNGETIISKSNMKYLYWNMNQQLAHHTINGCNIEVGDMYASGTISGPDQASFGSMLELSWNGKKPLTLQGGVQRTFVEDGDTVIMRGYAQKNGLRIGFGECRGKILPSIPTQTA